MIWPIKAAVFYLGAVVADFFIFHRQDRPSRNRARKTQAQSESLIARGMPGSAQPRMYDD